MSPSGGPVQTTTDPLLGAVVRNVLAEGGHRVTTRPDGTLSVRGVGEHHDLTVEAHIAEADRQVTICALVEGGVPADRRAVMADFVLRANHVLRVGGFDLDLDDGHLRFKIGVDVDGDELRPPMVRQLLRTAIAAVDTFAPAIDDVLAGRTDTAQLLRELGAPPG